MKNFKHTVTHRYFYTSYIWHFCCAMLCKCALCRHAVSVRPSVTFIYSVKNE